MSQISSLHWFCAFSACMILSYCGYPQTVPSLKWPLSAVIELTLRSTQSSIPPGKMNRTPTTSLSGWD